MSTPTSSGNSSPLSVLSHTPSPPNSPSFLSSTNTSLLASSSPATIPFSQPSSSPPSTNPSTNTQTNTKVTKTHTKKASQPKPDNQPPPRRSERTRKVPPKLLAQVETQAVSLPSTSTSQSPSPHRSPAQARVPRIASLSTSPAQAPKAKSVQLQLPKQNQPAPAKNESSPKDKKRRFTDMISENQRALPAASRKLKLNAATEQEADTRPIQKSAPNPLEHLEPPFGKFWDASIKPTAAPLEPVPSANLGSGLLYFAYSYDMSAAYMESKFPGCVTAGVAKLRDFKWGIGSCSGYPTIAEMGGDVVWGVVFEVSDRDLAILSSKGARRGLKMKKVDVDVQIQDVDINIHGKKEDAKVGVKIKVYVLVGELQDEETRTMEKKNREMNRAIFEAKMMGMEIEYVDGVLRKSVPFPKEPIFW